VGRAPISQLIPLRKWRRTLVGWRDQHGRALQPALAQIGERFVGAFERISDGMRHDIRMRREAQKIEPIAAGKIGDRDKPTFFPEERIGKARDVAHVNSGADDGAAFLHGGERQRDERADRRVDDRRVERFGCLFVRASCPDRAQAAGKILRSAVAWARKRKNSSAALLRHLRDDMRRRAEAIEAKIDPFAGHHERTPADESGAEQRRKLLIASCLAERKRIARVSDRMRGEASVARIAGEQRRVAEIFPPGAAIRASTVGMAEPGNADAHAERKSGDARTHGVNSADDLVAGDDRQFRVRQFSVDHMKIGAADAAGRDLDADFAGARLRIGQILKDEGRANLLQDHSAHKTLASHCNAAD
jgi:hypothetical protein